VPSADVSCQTSARAALAITVALLTWGCGGAAPTAPTSSRGVAAPSGAVTELGGAVDPAPFLRVPPPAAPRTWLVPRSAALDLGSAGAPSEATSGDSLEPIEALVVESAATQMRVAVQTDVLRLVVWVPRGELFGVLTRDVSLGFARTAAPAREPSGEPSVAAILRRGAQVQVLERGAERSRVRYLGAVELDTWVPSDALSDRSTAPRPEGAEPSGPQLLHALPGLAIRAEPRWGGELLAVVARVYFVTDVRQLDAAWHVVRYADAAVTVQGFASPRDPPMRFRPAATAPLSKLVADTSLPPGTCLYADERGAVVGMVAAAAPAATEGELREGWWTVALDTPWGVMRFAARRQQGAWSGCELD
jgi:hypothetical protein